MTELNPGCAMTNGLSGSGRKNQVAYQFLIVVAGGSGRIVSGNPFKGPRSALVITHIKSLFRLVLLLFYAWFSINWGIKQNNRQRIFNSRGYLTNKTHAGRGFQSWGYSLFYRQKLDIFILNEKSGAVKHFSILWDLLTFARKIIFKIGPGGSFSQSSLFHYNDQKKIASIKVLIVIYILTLIG